VRAGFALLFIEIFSTLVAGNGISLWPQYADLPVVVRALVMGLFSGLFYELGRFVVLDRLMPKVRSFRQGVAFGMGWAGMEMFFLGFALIVAAFLMNFILINGDISQAFPNATADQLQQLADFKDQATQLVNGNPLVALTPLLERFCLMIFDVAMTLLILFGFTRGESRYTWLAVASRGLLIALLIGAGSINPLLAEPVFVLFAVGAFFVVRWIRRSYPEQLR
jgi:uncharacterized membrane protein YhfC